MSEDQQSECRVLVENSEASIIIGKGGSNAKTIRESYDVYISLLKNENIAVKERVMILKGSTNNVSNALSHIANLLTDSSLKPTSDDQATMTCRILIHKFLAGAIIGKGGDISKQIKADTGIRMRVSNEPLPGSTEKVVTLTGTPEMIHTAGLRVLQQLADNPLRPGCVSIPYKPGVIHNGLPFPGYPPHPNPNYPVLSPPVSSSYPVLPGMYGQYPYPDPQQHYPSNFQSPTLPVYEKKVEKIIIPTASAGTVIGSRGSIIRDIKAQSGCNISIAAAETSKPEDRVVTITGSTNGIQTAIYLIRQRIERPTYATHV